MGLYVSNVETVLHTVIYLPTSDQWINIPDEDHEGEWLTSYLVRPPYNDIFQGGGGGGGGWWWEFTDYVIAKNRCTILLIGLCYLSP